METYGSPCCGFSPISLYKQCFWLTECGTQSSCGFITGAHPHSLSFIVVRWNDDDSFHLASKLNFHFTLHVKCPCLHSDIFVICNSASVANTALIRAQRKREKKSSCFEIKQLVHLLPIPMSTSTTNYCRDTNTLDLLGDMYKYHFKLGAAGDNGPPLCLQGMWSIVPWPSLWEFCCSCCCCCLLANFFIWNEGVKVVRNSQN